MSCNEMDGALNEFDISSVNAKIPRRVYPDRVSINVLAGMMVVVLVGLIGSFCLSYNDIRNSHTRDILLRDGRTVDGEVAKSSANRDGVYVKYAFSVDGAMHSGHAEMRDDHYTVPGTGEKITIRYLPSDPNVNQPVDWVWFSAWDIYPFIFVLFTIVASAVVMVVALRQRTLARMGVVVEGKVTGCAPNQKLFKVYYEFTTQENTALEGSTDLPDEYEVGASIPIIYLRSNPARNNRYPVGGFCIAE